MISKDFKKAEVVAEIFGNPDAPYTRYPLEQMEGAEHVFFTLYELDAQVGNGGFAQYFWNGTDEHPAWAVASLIEIGAFDAARIANRAVELAFGSEGVPADTASRHKALDGLTEEDFEALSNLTSEFHHLPGDLMALLYDYVVANQGAVRGAAAALSAKGTVVDRLRRIFRRK